MTAVTNLDADLGLEVYEIVALCQPFTPRRSARMRRSKLALGFR
jgi:hypothetical protein